MSSLLGSSVWPQGRFGTSFQAEFEEYQKETLMTLAGKDLFENQFVGDAHAR